MMQEWYKCPECGKDLLYGANPCTFCKCSLAWSQQGPVLYLPPIGAPQQQLAKSPLSMVSNDMQTTPVNVAISDLPIEMVMVAGNDTPGTLINKLKKWQRNQIMLSIGIGVIITACLFCAFVWIPNARTEGYNAGYAQANKENEAKAKEIAALVETDYQDLERDYQGLDRTNQALEQEGWSLERRNQDLQSRNTSLQSQNRSLQSQNSSLQSQNSSLQSQNSSLQSQVWELMRRCTPYY
jgi:hypothetical protein